MHFDGPSIAIKRGLKTKDVRFAHPTAAAERRLGAHRNGGLVVAASNDRSPGVDAIGGKRHAGGHDVCRWKSQQATALIAPLHHTFNSVGAAEQPRRVRHPTHTQHPANGRAARCNH